MTVFSTFYSDVSQGEQPIIISDVLITSSHQLAFTQYQYSDRYKRIYLPSIGGLYPHEASKDVSITGVMQKTYVLENNVCITVAGDCESAQEFYYEMQKVTDLDGLVKTCAKFHDQLQFVVFFVDLDGCIHCVATDNCKRMQSGCTGLTIVGGRGESSLRELILKHETLPFQGDEKMGYVARLLWLLSDALDHDQSNPRQTLTNTFGAYYELTAFDGQEFYKLEKILFSYWTITISDTGPVWQPTRMFYHEYVENVLIVRRIELSVEGIWQDCYGIGGFNSQPTVDFVQQHVEKVAPHPIMEIATIQLNGFVFRISALDQPIIRFEKKSENWFVHCDEELLRKYTEFFADELDKYHSPAR